ncbi:MAG: hypothetical protein R2853_20200 [Thermomicrobiales bacterium]
MTAPDADSRRLPDVSPLRSYLIATLDQVLWLSQWSANVTTLTAVERQELQRHLEILDGALRGALAQHRQSAARAELSL